MRTHLTTDRLTLRPFDISDVKGLVAACNDWDIARQTASLPYPYLDTHAHDWIISMSGGTDMEAYIYAVTYEANIIGCVSLSAVGQSWDLGYWLAKGHWHQGLMQETVAALLTEAERAMPEATLTASVFADNPRSLALLNRNGFMETAPPQDDYCVARQAHVRAYKLTRQTTEAHYA